MPVPQNRNGITVSWTFTEMHFVGDLVPVGEK
ncbi:hypothetical protein LCGC14_2820010, partial [marine sediment metagenome]